MTINCKITEAGVTRRFTLDEDGNAGWRILFAFIAKCEGRKDYKEYGRQKAAESDAILIAAKAAKLEMEEDERERVRARENRRPVSKPKKGVGPAPGLHRQRDGGGSGVLALGLDQGSKVGD